jgi:membrane protease YdiL (CAAX protease family)
VGPVFEELLFRGLVFGELRKVATVRLALVIQALIFGLYHINPIQGAYAFLIGLLLGYVYYRSSSIVAPMIVHAAINTSSVVAGRLIDGVSCDGWGTPVAIAGLLLFFLTGAFILLHRSFRHVMDDGLYRANRAPKIQPPQENGR